MGLSTRPEKEKLRRKKDLETTWVWASLRSVPRYCLFNIMCVTLMSFQVATFKRLKKNLNEIIVWFLRGT